MTRSDCAGKPIPPCIELAMQMVETRGLQVEGIFRISGNQGMQCYVIVVLNFQTR